jgi:hypothetical protein
MSRGTLKCLIIAAAALALSFVTQNIARLTDCRDYAHHRDAANRAYFLENACPDPGPYTHENNVFLYALAPPFLHLQLVGPEVSVEGSGTQRSSAR